MNSKDQCCPKFNPKPWDEKTHQWQNKLFIKETLPQLFHMPWPPMVGKMVQKQWEKAEKARAAPKLKDFLWLCYDPSPWKSEHFIHVTKKVPGAKNVKIRGTFISKVFDGPYNAALKWAKEMDQYLANQGKKPKRYYFYFTTCPKCAKKYGHNYVVLFAKIK